MSYSRQGDRVTIELSVDSYQQLLIAMGHALSFTMASKEHVLFSRWLELANEINDGNPAYTPYEIPKETE